MPTFHYGASPDLVSVDARTGRPRNGVSATFFDAEVSGSQDLTILDEGGGIGGVAISGVLGRWEFTSAVASELWLDTGTGVRWLVRARESYGPKGDPGAGAALAIGTVTTGAPAATITGVSPAQVLNLVLPAGTPGSPGLQGDPGPAGGPVPVGGTDGQAVVKSGGGVVWKDLGVVPRWAPATAYALGFQVVSPGNDVVAASVAHTSAAAYATDVAKWSGSNTYARLGYPGRPGPLTAIKATLDAGIDHLAIQTVTDSTGSGATRWPQLLATSLAAMFPAYTVQHTQWSDVTQSYPPPTVMQTGPLGMAYGAFAGTRSLVTQSVSAITGDLDVRVKAAPTFWVGAAPVQTFLSKFGGAGARSLRWQTAAAGKLSFEHSADGSTLIGHLSTAGVPFTDGQTGWARVTLDVDNGAGGHTVTFYTSPDGVAWTQLGAPVITAGVTSFFNSAQDWEIGARGGTAEGLTGNIYEVEARDGINGPNVLPRYARLWNQSGGDTSVVVNGSPVLTIVNGAMSGAGQAYLADATRLPKLVPYDYGTAAVILSCSHNDGPLRGRAYWATWDTWLASIKARLPLAPVTVMTQNPRIAPAVDPAHPIRMQEGVRWAARNGLGYIDVCRAFNEDGRAMSVLLNVDGLHPSDAAGSPLWRDTTLAAINGRT